MNFRNMHKRVTYGLFLPNIIQIWPVVSEKKIVEIVDTRRTTTNDDERRRKMDIQGITKAHPEHSSGELKCYRQQAFDKLI